MNEQGILKATFARYIDILDEEAGQDEYLSWLHKNINTAWKNRDCERKMMLRDYDMSLSIGNIQSCEASSRIGFMQAISPVRN